MVEGEEALLSGLDGALRSKITERCRLWRRIGRQGQALDAILAVNRHQQYAAFPNKRGIAPPSNEIRELVGVRDGNTQNIVPAHSIDRHDLTYGFLKQSILLRTLGPHQRSFLAFNAEIGPRTELSNNIALTRGRVNRDSWLPFAMSIGALPDAVITKFHPAMMLEKLGKRKVHRLARLNLSAVDRYRNIRIDMPVFNQMEGKSQADLRFGHPLLLQHGPASFARHSDVSRCTTTTDLT
jgi:hypothetical protein